jgi:hypothetical protein
MGQSGDPERVPENLYEDKAIIGPYLPRDLLEVRLAEVFNMVERYHKESGVKALQSFEQAKVTLRNFSSEAERYGTRYSRLYLQGLGVKLQELMLNHAESSLISQPAELTVEKSEKKYPFSDAGKDFHITLNLKMSDRDMLLMCSSA